MASQWYYLKDDGVQQGPISSADLKKLATTGKLDPTDMVWKEGMSDWADASNVKGLFSSSKPASKPAPAAPKTPAPAPQLGPAPARAPEPTAQVPTPDLPPTLDLTPINPFGEQPQNSLPMSDDPFGDVAALSAGMQPAMVPMNQAAGYGQMPMGQPQMQPAMPQAMGNPYASSMARPKRPFRPKVKTHVWGILLTMAASLMILSFVSPWWGMRLYHPTKEEQQAWIEKNRKKAEEMADEMRRKMEEGRSMSEEEIERMVKKAKEKEKRDTEFYKNYKIGPYDSDFKRRDVDEGESKIWLVWGWQTGSGIAALVLGLVLLPLSIVFGFIKPLQPWSWIIFFVSVGAGVAMIVVFPNWFFFSPDENQLPVVRQGVIAGPWMALVSGLAVSVCGLTGGIMGLIAFVKR